MAGKRDEAVLSQRQVELLNQIPVGHLATADNRGRPHVIPFCFACDGESIYSALDAKPKIGNLRGLRRVRNILENPRVSIVIDHYEADWSRLWYLLVQGRAELLEPCPEQAAAISLLRGKYDQYREMDLEHSPVIKITPDRATGWSGA